MMKGVAMYMIIAALATLMEIWQNPIPNPQNRDGLWSSYYANLPHGGGNVALDKSGHDNAYATRIEVIGLAGRVSSDGGGMSEMFAIVPGSYDLSAWYKGALADDVVLRPGVDLFDNAGNRIARVDDAIYQEQSDWTQWRLAFTAPPSTATAQAFFSMWQDGTSCGFVYVSDWDLQPVADVPPAISKEQS